ncbi:two-component sensor histidine kinase [Clostridium sp. W14A]|uniref:histidine kinase n=1 Tax=Caproicibacter fermentans TaxID=2576756 RepID=A0A7G8TAJ7_9FIRM|nr:HAMP domain-containing sensor histidine kinase [Caproicibacter fermentans]OCN03024.1 two-component sensor histidine kinase [Clostridium sp. W14A]QNK40638.1 HAMP domain-containing histidine kinase [Caproicibacter fermentans]
MKAFGKYISKHLASFAAFNLVLALLNVLAFGITFQSVIRNDYGDTSPQTMLEEIAAASTVEGVSDDARQKLESAHIWAMFLNQGGNRIWAVNIPKDIPGDYTIQDVALFSKGYLKDYPVFVWNTEDGLLVLGYPKDSYTKLTSNYFSIHAIQTLPLYMTGMLTADFLFLFLAYYFSRRKIIRSTEPIIDAIETLSDGKPVSLAIGGDLSEVAGSINKASRILSKQNEARANWISGVSHDIRTPLSMILGYAGRIADNKTINSSVKDQAEIVRQQSIKIKELVQDLNLVSHLEYEMQPLHKEPVRLSKLLRSYAVELLNGGLSESYPVEVGIKPAAENVILECDSRLIMRAINNLVQNSFRHNPQGCEISLTLDYSEAVITLTVADNGVGLSAEKLRELKESTHYMESTDERLNLRHGLGLLLVRQIVEAHCGTMTIESEPGQGYQTVLCFQVQASQG